MKYVPTQDYSFLLDENHYVYNYVENEDSLHIYIKSKEHGCACPVCGKMSTKLHATYRRKLQDTPIHCKQTFLHANVYKYDCENPDCECKVFMEDLPFAKASQVRTDALNTLVLAVSMFLSNEGASKVLSLLGIQISNDTIQRLYDRIEFIDDPDVEEIGVDDVAIRKGQTYATAKSATTSSTGSLLEALKRAFLLLAQKGGVASILTGPLKSGTSYIFFA